MGSHSRTNPPNINLLLRIEVAMHRKGWKQADLARAMGVTDGAVSHWFKSRFEPDKDLLLALSRALGVSVDWLMGKQLSAEDQDLERYLLGVMKNGGTDLLRALESLSTEQVVKAILAAAEDPED